MRKINKQTSREKQALPMLTDGVRIQQGFSGGLDCVCVCVRVCVSLIGEEEDRSWWTGSGGERERGNSRRERSPLIGLFVPVEGRERERERERDRQTDREGTS